VLALQVGPFSFSLASSRVLSSSPILSHLSLSRPMPPAIGATPHHARPQPALPRPVRTHPEPPIPVRCVAGRPNAPRPPRCGGRAPPRPRPTRLSRPAVAGAHCGGINPYTLMARHGQAQTRRSGPLHDDARSISSGWSLAQGIKPDLGIKQGLGRLD
jgi:hypothetical protein